MSDKFSKNSFAKNSKGQVLDIWGTVMVLFTAALVIFAMIGVYFLGEVLNKLEMHISVENLINKPYTTGDILSVQKIDDRSLLEHALEITIAGDMINSKSYNLASSIESVMKKLGFIRERTLFPDEPKYSIIIKNNTKEFVKIGKNENEMSDETSNYAVIPLLYKDGKLGYVKIIIER